MLKCDKEGRLRETSGGFFGAPGTGALLEVQVLP